MSFTRIASASGVANTASSPVDTTGADLLIVWIGYGTASTTISDSYTNAWNQLPVAGNSTLGRFFYCRGGTVGVNHTVSVSESYGSIFFVAYAGSAASPYDRIDRDFGNASTYTPGTAIATTENNELVLAGLVLAGNSSSPAISGGPTLVQLRNGIFNVSYGGAIAEQIQTTASNLSPTWIWVGTNEFAVAYAVFKAAAVPATGITVSGPTSGQTGVASSNFSVGANGIISDSITVTPSDPGGGGTFTPSSVTISNSSATATFTYTPASAGAKTISVTNNGALMNPAGLTYTASGSASAPTINTQPSSQSVVTAATATFTVAASGTPTLTYQWQRNGTNISGATSASYTTGATTVGGGIANNGDIFRCSVSNAVDTTVSNSATLAVTAMVGANFDNSPLGALQWIPMEDIGDTATVQGIRHVKQVTPSGNFRYVLPAGTALKSIKTASMADDSDHGDFELCRLTLPADCLTNGETCTISYTYTLIGPVGNGALLVWLGGYGNEAYNRSFFGFTGGEVTKGTVTLTGLGTNAALMDSPTLERFGLNISGPKDINLLAPITLIFMARYQAPLNVGSTMNCTASATFNAPQMTYDAQWIDPRLKPFDADSWINRPLSRVASLQSPTDLETAKFRDRNGIDGNNIIFYGENSTGIAQASARDPLETWHYGNRGSDRTGPWPFKTDNGTVQLRTPVNLPALAASAVAGGDNNIALFTADGRFYIEAFQYSFNAATKEHFCATLVLHDLFATGWPSIYDRTDVQERFVGIRASGGPLLAMLVRGWEVIGGKIEHCVPIMMPYPKQKTSNTIAVNQQAGLAPTVQQGGTGYKLGDVLTVSGGTGRPAEVTVTGISAADRAVISVWVTNTGAYATGPATTFVTTTGGSGNGCTLALNLLEGDKRVSRVWPATAVDVGYTGYQGAVPLGSLWTIPPYVDVATLGLTTPEAVAYARAVQKYGAYNVDSSDYRTQLMFLCAADVTPAQRELICGPDDGHGFVNMQTLAANMVMVRNNTPFAPGGYGQRLTTLPFGTAPSQ